MKIITNHVPRDIIDAHELTPAERKEFSYLDTSETRSWDDAEFFRYRGTVYDLGEFLVSDVPGWDGQHTDSFFSAILVRYVSDNEQVICGLALS